MCLDCNKTMELASELVQDSPKGCNCSEKKEQYTPKVRFSLEVEYEGTAFEGALKLGELVKTMDNVDGVTVSGYRVNVW